MFGGEDVLDKTRSIRGKLDEFRDTGLKEKFSLIVNEFDENENLSIVDKMKVLEEFEKSILDSQSNQTTSKKLLISSEHYSANQALYQASSPSPSKTQHITIVLIGPPGSGKTSFINLLHCYSRCKSFQEYFLHAETSTKFDQISENQSKEITTTQINLPLDNTHYCLNLIKMPSFDDTDASKSLKLKSCLLRKLESLGLNGFLVVTNGRETRLTNQQQFYINMIKQMVGEQILTNVVYLQTNQNFLNKQQLTNFGANHENAFCYDNFILNIDPNDPTDSELKDKAAIAFEKLRSTVKMILDKFSKMKKTEITKLSDFVDASTNLRAHLQKLPDLLTKFYELQEDIAADKKELEKLDLEIKKYSGDSIKCICCAICECKFGNCSNIFHGPYKVETELERYNSDYLTNHYDNNNPKNYSNIIYMKDLKFCGMCFKYEKGCKCVFIDKVNGGKINKQIKITFNAEEKENNRNSLNSALIEKINFFDSRKISINSLWESVEVEILKIKESNSFANLYQDFNSIEKDVKKKTENFFSTMTSTSHGNTKADKNYRIAVVVEKEFKNKFELIIKSVHMKLCSDHQLQNEYPKGAQKNGGSGPVGLKILAVSKNESNATTFKTNESCQQKNLAQLLY